MKNNQEIRQSKIIHCLFAMMLCSCTLTGNLYDDDNGNNGNNGNSGNSGNNGNNGNNGNTGKGQFKEKAQQVVAKASEEYSITPEQQVEIEMQAEIMLEGIEQANNQGEQQQLSQNYQMAINNILTEAKQQKKAELKAQRKKFNNK